MSAVFILASLHFLLSTKLFGSDTLSKLLLCIPMSLGLFSIIYKQIIYVFFISNPIYKVTGIKKINYNTIEATLEPKEKALSRAARDDH